jgi:hypothetical protein
MVFLSFLLRAVTGFELPENRLRRPVKSAGDAGVCAHLPA